MTKEYKTRLRYPDPFRPNGLDLVLPEDGIVSIQISDDGGNEVSTIVDGQQFNAGNHTIDLNLSACGSGNYFYRITYIRGGETVVETKRFVLGL